VIVLGLVLGSGLLLRAGPAAVLVDAVLVELALEGLRTVSGGI